MFEPPASTTTEPPT